MSLNSTPATWTAGENPTATKMNTEIRDAFAGLQAAWDTYTPTWSSGGTQPALGNGTLTGRYLQVGKTVKFRIKLVTGSTTTYGNSAFIFSLPPVALHSDYVQETHLGRVSCSPSAGARYPRTAVRGSTSTTLLMFDEAGAAVGPTTPFTWASGAVLFIVGEYEAA